MRSKEKTKLYLEKKYSFTKEKDIVKFFEGYFLARQPSTYYDQECKDLHCDRERRSLIDLKSIYETYNPDTEISFEDIFLAIPKMNLQKNNENGTILLRLCSEVGRIVLRYTTRRSLDPFNIHFLDYEEDDLSNTSLFYKKGEEGWSGNEIKDKLISVYRS